MAWVAKSGCKSWERLSPTAGGPSGRARFLHDLVVLHVVARVALEFNVAWVA